MKRERKFGVPRYSIENEVRGDDVLMTITRRVDHDNVTFTQERRLYAFTKREVERLARRLGIIPRKKP